MVQILSIIFLFFINLNISYAGIENLRSSFESGRYQDVISFSKQSSVHKMSSSELNLVGSSFFRLQKKRCCILFFLGLKKTHLTVSFCTTFRLASNESIDLIKDKVIRF